MHLESPVARDSHDIRGGLAEAAKTAGYAPSIDNTQPWRWRIGPDTLDLQLQPDRVPATDPEARLSTISCGAALHHARIALAAEGWQVTVARMPDAANEDHLASVRVYAPAVVDDRAAQRVRTIPLRHTNRRPVTGTPIGPEDLRAIVAAIQLEGAWLHIVRPEQLVELIGAAGQAQRTGAGEPRWQADLAYWTQVRAEDSPSAEQDDAATFGILYGHSDERRDWLRAGEALSACWLIATERGISVLPFSAPVEISETRDAMRHILAYLNHPYLVLRFGSADPADTSLVLRRPAPQTIERW